MTALDESSDSAPARAEASVDSKAERRLLLASKVEASTPARVRDAKMLVDDDGGL